MSPSSMSTVAEWRDTPPRDRLATLPPWDWEATAAGRGQRTLGFAAAGWAEKRLIQPNGPRAGKPFAFTGDQLLFLLWWYAVDDQGRWLYTHGARRLAKGSGKSPFAAVWALTEFLGPVRLDRFDDRVLGGCVGRPVPMPLVQIAATAESQTANTMRMVRAFAPKGSALVEEYNLDVGKTLYYKVPEGSLHIITSSATAAEGAEASAVVADETEHWKPSNGGPELMETLADNLAKNGERMIETANAWKPGQETTAESTYEAWVAQEEGRTRGETKILYDARLAPPATDMADPASLKSALHFVYGDCDWKKPTPDSPPDVRAIMEKIWRPSSKPDDSKRKYLNWPTAPADAWTTPQEWAALAAPQPVDKREEIVLFFDGSKSRDATALVACRMSDGHVFTIKVWEPSTAHDTEDVVDVADVDRVVRHAATGAYGKVVGFFGDVKEWESFVTVSWPPLFSELLVQATGGQQAQPIAWDMRNRTKQFTLACELVEAEIIEKLFTHDNHAALSRHVANARRRPNRYGVSIGKESPDSPKKIDAAVCMVGARMVRGIVLSSPSWAKRTNTIAAPIKIR